MGAIYFSLLAVWVLSPDWRCCKLQRRDVVRRLGEVAVPEGRDCGPCPDSALYILA
jgi:hypothetical protein